MTQLVGPVVIEEPLVLYRGESFKPRLTLYDGVKTASLPYGSPIDLSAGTKTAVLRINAIMGDGTDVTRNVLTGGEGEKTDGANGVVTFFVANTVTGNAGDFLPGLYDFEIEYQDTAPTPDDVRLVTIGRLDVREKPSAT